MREMEAAKATDTVSYNTLVKAHLRRCNYNGARAVMEEMRKAGCPPNIVTYNELVDSLVRTDRPHPSFSQRGGRWKDHGGFERHGTAGSQAGQVWDIVDEMR